MQEEGLYLYKPLPGPGFTRILTVQRAFYDDGAILCHIESALIHEPSNYAALSYSWAMNDGDVSLCRSIVIDGRLKIVTRNLYEALRRLRRRNAELRIWVDAVCINQSDALELSSQVLQMDEIYRNASSVFAWLGEPQSDIEGQNILHWLEGSLRPDDHLDSLWYFENGEVADLYTVYCSSKRREDINLVMESRFLMARYWTRQWIVQELAIPEFARIQIVWVRPVLI